MRCQQVDLFSKLAASEPTAAENPTFHLGRNTEGCWSGGGGGLAVQEHGGSGRLRWTAFCWREGASL